MGSSSSKQAKPAAKSSSKQSKPAAKSSSRYKVQFTSGDRKEFNKKLVREMLTIPVDKRLKFLHEMTPDEITRSVNAWFNYYTEGKKEEVKNMVIRDLLATGRKHSGGFMVCFREDGTVEIIETESLPGYVK